jgi:pimeloyl-ACP methyl ester carboxylesterase
MNRRIALFLKMALLLTASLLALSACTIQPLSAPEETSPQPATEEATGEEGVTETVVDVGDGVVGTITRPAAAGPVPAVLMLHGFASSRDEVGDMYRREADALAQEGIASLRIDFRGGGDSEGAFEDTTIQGQVSDAETALAYLRQQDFVDPERVGALGFSLGGGIATILAGEHPNEVASLVVWSTVGDLVEDFIEDLGEEMFDEAAANGSAFQDLGWRTITLKKEFFDSLDDFDLFEEMMEYPGAFMAIAGGDDSLSGYADAFAEVASGPSQTLIVPGADHIYHVLSDDQAAAETVIDATADRFAETLEE